MTDRTSSRGSSMQAKAEYAQITCGCKARLADDRIASRTRVFQLARPWATVWGHVGSRRGMRGTWGHGGRVGHAMARQGHVRQSLSRSERGSGSMCRLT